MAYYRAVTQVTASIPERIGVLLVNLGTPDSPTYFAVQRYLREFLSDRRVINTAPALWLPILYGVVLPFRPLRSAANYRKIWMQDGSPLAVYSHRLTNKLGDRLHATLGDRVRVALGMTYGNPSIASAVRILAEQNVRRLLVLPLYPQYCSSTTGSVFDRIIGGAGTLALDSRDALHQRLLCRCRLYRRACARVSGSIGSVPASARTWCSPITACPPPT